MPFCRECGNETESFDQYCRRCGVEVGSGATVIGASRATAQETAPVLDYTLSPTRIPIMSVLSYGVYFFTGSI